MPPKGSRKAAGTTIIKSVSDSVCYCDGERALGTVELFCNVCTKWFHTGCLKDLKGFQGIPFMVSYVFHCKDCSPTEKETWTVRQPNFAQMSVTTLANLTVERLREASGNTGNGCLLNHEKVFISLRETIIPYMDSNWENLTTMPRRVKNTWHNTLEKTLLRETDLFLQHDDKSSSFALSETLINIGPATESLKTTTRRERAALDNKSDAPDEGPKTRGSNKRRNVDAGATISKRPKLTAESASARVTGFDSTVDFPFNKDGCRYFIVEHDPNVPEKWDDGDDYQARAIPPHTYRILTSEYTSVSPHDRAHQLRLEKDYHTLTGYEGYSVARGTHSVAKGTWYYEVNFLRQPNDSHIRVGWAQGEAVLQTCVGYNKLSYAWRSRKGTKFHNGHGKTYRPGGFKEGDVLGILIHLPHDSAKPGASKNYLPPSFKDAHLINFKHQYFFEMHDDAAAVIKDLVTVPGSYIEYYLNGESCGKAFEDIYAGLYYPAVSIYENATVRMNLGPKFQHLPRGAKPICDRPKELHVEQALSDMLFLVEHDHI